MNSSTAHVQQSAALIVHAGRVCLVTASSGRRWILPKGTLEPGQTLAECAVMEAWEEAGIHGRAGRRPLARYESRKAGRPCIVSIFRLFVEDIADNWPERDLRRRRWVSISQAIAEVDVAEVRKLLRGLHKRKSKPAAAARS